MTAHSPDDETKRLLQLSEEVTRIAGALASLTMGMTAASGVRKSPAKSESPDVSARSVDFVIRARRARANYVPDDLFAEPAWDMALDLLRAEIEGQRVSMSDLCLAAGVPGTTALRWITALVERGLLVREPDRYDARKTFVKLDPNFSAALRRYFAEIIEAAWS